MKKLIVLILLCALVLSLTGCIELTEVNTESNNETSNTAVGIGALKEIGGQLYYDTNTGIVYWWNGHGLSTGAATVPSAYFAPNGLPYKYNPETKTLEEIK